MYRAAIRRVFTYSLPLNTTIFKTVRPYGLSYTLSRQSLKCQFHQSSNRIKYVHDKTLIQPPSDTIYALSSAEGKAGIAVIRISGPSCIHVYEGLCPTKPPPKPRYATVRTLCHPHQPESGRAPAPPEVLDSAALVLYFPAPKTVTGDDVLELHVHGGSATVKAVLAAIPQCASTTSTTTTTTSVSSQSKGGRIRYAEPGEFTKRAFLNDRLDLSQVEALGAILAAETEQQRRAAVRGSSGALGRTYEGWRGALLRARAELEALIDFAEDQHFDDSPGALVGGVTARVREILRGIGAHERAGERAELLRAGVQIALVGPPNAGKSSLMNLVVGREASIVSGESGTTRDIVEANLDMRGYLCTFADTAGFRTAAEPPPPLGNSSSTDRHVSEEEVVQQKIGAVEMEGIRRARARAAQSDVIIVLASVEPLVSGGGYQICYDLETLALAARCQERLVVVNKRDAVSEGEMRRLLRKFTDEVLGKVEGLEDVQPILISCKEAQDQGSDQMDPGGVRLVADRLVSSFAAMTSLPTALQDLHGVTERQRQLLVQCRGHLEDYIETVGSVEPEENDGAYDEAQSSDLDVTMAAEHLRYAANCLGRITGRGEAGDVEEILGVIFEKFCVGK
ncbi:P-loop containing nucleoside triphosphate hydrolase protein [Whalleya microplaca]|nr:P-loop containing nucleoside triphosphate hydrolase protein [Whalleya microplaca]